MNPLYQIRFFHRVLFALVLSYFFSSCKKMVSIDPPTSSITTKDAFRDSAEADEAITGIYTRMINNNGNTFLGNGAVTVFCGLSADELVNFKSDPSYVQLYTNQVLSSNGLIYSYLWSPAYTYIYQANACIEGLHASSTLPNTVQTRLLGESRFLRAFCYFYLVNLFGDVPLITTTDWAKSTAASRSSKGEVYKQIIADLTDAEQNLPDDYGISGGERIRATKWAAIALLSRVSLYTGDYSGAVNLSSTLINTQGLFSLVDDLNSIFLANSNETILQLKQNTSSYPFTATAEGNNFIPRNNTSSPSFYLPTGLLNAFEPGDYRKSAWTATTKYQGKVYYYPYKYKTGPAQRQVNGAATEYYMVLRLTEQYLIRAEASAMNNDLVTATGDLNLIRQRAGLPSLSNNLDKDGVLKAVAQERRIELFDEWGNRWLDLKRTGQADAVLAPLKPAWKQYQSLYPIPLNELNFSPNLTQNPGY